MNRSHKRPRFLLDLAEELTRLKDHAGAEVAERWYQAFKEMLCFIENNPFIGRERKDLKPERIRSWRIKDFSRWLIFYSVTEDKRLVFLRVRSGTMNLVVLKMQS